VAKQQIFAETVKAELRNHHKNRTTDFTFNPRNGNKYRLSLILLVQIITAKPNVPHF
jgi:hypothetical protein